MAIITGTANDELIVGTIDSDQIFALAGRDSVDGGAGADTIRGGEGDDSLVGGDDLRTVYATTARLHLSEEQRRAQPLAGGLFSFRVETPGLPQNAVRVT